MSKKSEEIKNSKAGIVAHIIGSIAYIAIGVCLLTLDVSLISRLAYSCSVLAGGILFICFGAYYMLKYFFNHEYTRVSNYGFTMGVILVIIGSAFIFKANYISGFIDVIVCIIGGLFGAIMLQQTFALFHMQRGTWIITLLFGAATIAASVYMLLNNAKFFNGVFLNTVYMIAVGGVSLFSLLLMVIGLRDHNKDLKEKPNKKKASVNEKEDTLDESIFEDEPVVQVIDLPDDEVPPVGSDAFFEE